MKPGELVRVSWGIVRLYKRPDPSEMTNSVPTAYMQKDDFGILVAVVNMPPSPSYAYPPKAWAMVLVGSKFGWTTLSDIVDHCYMSKDATETR